LGVRDQDRVDQSGIEIVEGNTAVAQLNWNVGLIEVHKKSAMSKTKKTTTDERANFSNGWLWPFDLGALGNWV
jgi:hypothetical protein